MASTEAPVVPKSGWAKSDSSIRHKILSYVVPERIDPLRSARFTNATIRNYPYRKFDFADLFLVSKDFSRDLKQAVYNRSVFEIHLNEQGFKFLNSDFLSKYKGVDKGWKAWIKSQPASSYSFFDPKKILHLKFIFWPFDFDKDPLAGLRMRTHVHELAEGFENSTLRTLTAEFMENIESECPCCEAIRLCWCGSFAHICADGTQHKSDFCDHLCSTVLHEVVIEKVRSMVEFVSAPLKRLRVSEVAQLLLPQLSDQLYDQGYADHFSHTISSQTVRDSRNDGYDEHMTDQWDKYLMEGPLNAPRYTDLIDEDVIEVTGDLATLTRDSGTEQRSADSSMPDSDPRPTIPEVFCGSAMRDSAFHPPVPEFYYDYNFMADPPVVPYTPYYDNSVPVVEETASPDQIYCEHGWAASPPTLHEFQLQSFDDIFPSTVVIESTDIHLAETFHSHTPLPLDPVDSVNVDDDSHHSDYSIISNNAESPVLIASSDINGSMFPIHIDDFATDPPGSSSGEVEQVRLFNHEQHYKQAEQLQQMGDQLSKPKLKSTNLTDTKRKKKHKTTVTKQDQGGEDDDWYLV